MLQVAGKRCVIAGGGPVALRRAQALAEAGAEVYVYAPSVVPELDELAIKVIREKCDPASLKGAFLVIIATDDPQANQSLADLARDQVALVNRADQAELGDLTFMTSHRDGPLTVAVHTGGASANAAVRIRELLVEQLDPDWSNLLTLALPVRQVIQQKVADPAERTSLLRRLSDDQAMAEFKAGGESALQAHYADIIKDLA